MELKSARISFLDNYLLAAIIIFLLILIFPNLNVFHNIFHYLLFFGPLLFVAYLFDEPEIKRYFTVYLIKENEVEKRWGIIRKKSISIPYPSITDLKFEKGFWGRIFNYGNIIVSSQTDKIVMKGIKNPEKVLEKIKKFKKKIEGTR